MANSDKKQPSDTVSRPPPTPGARAEGPAPSGRHGGVPEEELDDLFEAGEHTPVDLGPGGDAASLLGVDTAGVQPPPGQDAEEILDASPYPAAGDGRGATIELSAEEPEVFAEATMESDDDVGGAILPPVPRRTPGAEATRPPPPPPRSLRRTEDITREVPRPVTRPLATPAGSLPIPPPPAAGAPSLAAPPPAPSLAARPGASSMGAPPPPPPHAPSIAAPPTAAPPPSTGAGEPSTLTDNALFRREAQALARARDWQKLAAVTSAAIDHATWVTLPETRAALLLDLARIHRDRLSDPVGAEESFRRLAQVDPTNEDALDYLSAAYRARGDWRAVYDLFSAAVEPTWDPNQRLEWTRETAHIATERLLSADLAIEAWERLDRLGDAATETYAALSEMYRRARRWDRLARFLGKRAAQLAGTERVVALREVAEAYLSGLRDPDHAGEVLEQILAARPDDTIALLAYTRVVARRGDWPALAALGERAMEGVPRAVVLDFRRVVADALWSAGHPGEAIEAYERVLELDPDDTDALDAKERFLTDEQARAAELIDFLVERAERVSTPERKAELLGRAAQLSEDKLDDARRAAELWARRVELPVGQLASHQALEHLYERLGDPPGVARSLEGQLALTRNPSARVELLRRLGGHSAHRMGNDDRAEPCWKEIISIVPDDRPTQDELLALHRRRGNFEALDQALASRAFRTGDKDEVLGFWRTGARNVEDNLRDPKRAVAAWQRVLDLAPEDDAALGAQVAHRRTLSDRRDLIAALEAELRVARDPAARRQRALEVATLWEAEGAKVAALAAYERALRWDPTDETALAALERLQGPAAAEVGSAIGALEVAAAHRGDAEQRIALLRRALALTDPADKLGQFYGLRRILWLSGRDPAVLAEVEKAAEAAEAWAELAAVYRALASEATDEPARVAHQRALARLYEQRLGDPARAFLVLQASELRPVASAASLAELQRLADSTARHEDLLAILDASAGAELPADTRKAMLRRRAEVLETRVKDAPRAFAECARLLQLDPHDAKALGDARRLAEERGLWRALDALYAELWDRATSVDERVTVALARQAIRAAHLKDAAGGLDMLLVAYRLAPAQPGLQQQLLDAAGQQAAWDRVLALVEARVRAASGDSAPDPDELAELGRLHESRRADRDRAFELYADSFVLRPDASTVDDEVRRLAEADKRFAPLAATYRLAASRAASTTRKLELLRRVADLATTRLGDEQVALDAHRRTLQLDPGALPSLERVIEHHRQAGEWRDLRERLDQWVAQAGEADAAARIPRWMEIARISRDKLGDFVAALSAAEKVLAADPAHAEALEAVRSLGGASEDPRFELRRLRIELPHTQAARRVAIQLACARIENEQLADAPAAIATLQGLVAETGADGPGFEPLAALLRGCERWAELAALIVARAERLPDAAARVASLEQAVAVYEEHLPDAPLESKEALFKRLLAERPDEAETRRRLLSLYRDAGRHEELAAALRDSLAAPGLDPEERRQFEAELYRVLALGLGRALEAEQLAAAGRRDADPEALLHRARIALGRGDFTAWLEARQQHARRLPPRHAALVLCHLAEACDELPAQQLRTAGLYREARALDPQNTHAMEALKAIGRRARNWRPAASLLPEANESKLPHPARSRRLVELAGQVAQGARGDGSAAADYLLRAVAIDPDNYAAWDALADLRAGWGDHGAALEARAQSLAAYERSVPPAPTEIAAHVARIETLAHGARTAGEGERAAQLSLHAHRLQPSYPAAALAVADRLLERGDEQAACALFDRVLRAAASAARLSDGERLHATYRRGALAFRLGRKPDAVRDLKAALAIDPLHGGALTGLAEALDDEGRVGAAATHYVQALLVEPAARARGALYARLGRLFEDKLGTSDEAGVCFDLSIATTPAGEVGDREVLARALAHYRRQGRPERALAVIERILPTIDDPREQAALWTERGAILSAASDEDRAVEAYDMALSYDPGNRGAITGLSRILERRGDWEQLAQIFEARTESGAPDERAEALRALARMAASHLHDPARAERYLRSVIELAPVREDYELLLGLYGDDPAHREGRMEALAGLLGLGGPFMPRVVEFGRSLVIEGDRRWAWCVLSPLMNTTLSDPQLKAVVLELRKEFEKSDNSPVLHPTTHRLVRSGEPRPALAALEQVVVELDLACNLGRTTLEAAGAVGTGRLDERTAVGKNFGAVAARLGLEGTLLSRAQELPEPFVVLDGDKGHAVVRAELLQLLSVAETAFLFAVLIEQTRPGLRLLASLRAAERPLLVPALYAACDLGEVPPGGEALVAAIRGQTSDEQRAAWGNRLLEHAEGEPAALGAELHELLAEAARRVGLLAAADLRFAAKVLTRLDETLPRLQTVGRLDDLDEFIAGAAPVRSLLGFAVTPQFGRLLHGEG